MEVADKYLPIIEDRKRFVEAKIDAYKGQLYGGVLEIKMAEANGEKRAVIQTEDQMKQIINNTDILFEELDNLED